MSNLSNSLDRVALDMWVSGYEVEEVAAEMGWPVQKVQQVLVDRGVGNA